MTGKERILAALAGELPDRVPFAPMLPTPLKQFHWLAGPSAASLFIADPPVEHQFDGMPRAGCGTALRAVLEHPAILPHGPAGGQILLDADPQRFLDVHVLARPSRRDGDRYVPIIAGGDVYPVHVRSGQHVAEVTITVAAMVVAFEWKREPSARKPGTETGD